MLMASRSWRPACVVALLAGVIPLAHAQPVADKPVLDVGDSWSFSQRKSDPGAAEGKMDKWSRKIVEILPDDRLRVQLGSGKVADYDGALNWMPDGKREYDLVLVRYPLRVGDKWDISRRFENPGQIEMGTAEVVAYESITVPAGTFQCYRVDAKTAINTKYYREFRSWNRWYCPDVKWIAKEKYETSTWSVANPAANGLVVTQTSELVRFTRGQ